MVARNQILEILTPGRPVLMEDQKTKKCWMVIPDPVCPDEPLICDEKQVFAMLVRENENSVRGKTCFVPLKSLAIV